MGFISKVVARVILNGVALYIAVAYFPNFKLEGGAEIFLVAALVLTFLNAFLRPILRLISLPLIWLSLGVFNIVIHILILWVADVVLTQLTITDFTTLFWVSIIIATANSFF